MYCEFVDLNSVTSRSNVLSKIFFEDCDINVKNFVENSTMTYTGSNLYIAHPEIKINGVYYNILDTVKKAPLGNHLRIIEKCLLGGVDRNGFGCGSLSETMTYTADVCSYIQELTLINMGNAVYKGYTTNKLKCELYNENDTKIGTIDGIAVSSGSGSLILNQYVKTLKFVFSTDIANGASLPVLALAKIVG
jgi:hypothetical protein